MVKISDLRQENEIPYEWWKKWIRSKKEFINQWSKKNWIPVDTPNLYLSPKKKKN